MTIIEELTKIWERINIVEWEIQKKMWKAKKKNMNITEEENSMHQDNISESTDNKFPIHYMKTEGIEIKENKIVDVLNEHIKNKTVRVKYLDIKDIENLGWKHTGGKLDGRTMQLFSKLTSKAYWVHLKVTFLSDRIVIGIETSVEQNSIRTLIVHSIGIKNKSELKKLMKQLNIE